MNLWQKNWVCHFLRLEKNLPEKLTLSCRKFSLYFHYSETIFHLNIYLRLNRHERKEGEKGNHGICHNRQKTNDGRRKEKKGCTIFCSSLSVEIRRSSCKSLKEREVERMNFKQATKRILFNICKNFVENYRKEQTHAKMSDERLRFSLNQRIHQIQENNSKRIIFNVLIPEVIKETLEKDNYLISESQAFHKAVQRFINKRNAGEIDVLNSFVEKNEKIKGE